MKRSSEIIIWKKKKENEKQDSVNLRCCVWLCAFVVSFALSTALSKENRRNMLVFIIIMYHGRRATRF